jgi:hypothetical protein
MENNNTHFRTSDTALAAYIQIEGFQIIDIDPSGQRTVFVFNTQDSDPKILELKRLFDIAKARVEPSIYLRTYKVLTRQARDGGV